MDIDFHSELFADRTLNEYFYENNVEILSDKVGAKHI
jgi:hypothetical protein